MSVIWSGITEEGAVVPVQVTDEGKVVAVGDGPEGDYLKLTGGNLTGDLTVNEQIELNSDGSATFSGDILVGSTLPLASETLRVVSKNPWNSVFQNENNASGDRVLYVTLGANAKGNSSSFLECNIAGVGPVAAIFGDGSATFSGDVVIGSRGARWLIRESNGVAMLIEQTLRGQTLRGQIEPRPEKVRDLPNELDLIETALNEVMAKLKMVPPAGWPVWDGQDEVTSDNDNA